MVKKHTAVIVAAGSSRRMKQGNKMTMPIAGIPVLARAMMQYQAADSISEIIVVTKKELFDTVADYAHRYNIGKFSRCVEGGADRQHSVLNGVTAAEDAEIISIADGARPFTSPAHIDTVANQAKADGAAILCVPATDTIKQIRDGKIVSTPPRKNLVQAQTPQTFVRDFYYPLLKKSIDDGIAVTDDSSIVESYGYTVTPVIGSYDNIKITTAEDLDLAERIAAQEEQK